MSTPRLASVAAGGGGFDDRLAVTLTLTIGGTAHAIPGGSVKELALDLQSYGFSGSLAFLVQDDQAHGGGFTDDLVTDFLKADLIEVSIEVAAVYTAAQDGDIESIKLAGLVTDKSVSEILFRTTADASVLVRRYRIAFADPAAVLWTQHYPCQLYTSKSMVDVINDHLGDKITVTCDFTALTEAKELVFLHLPRDLGASFYDFLCWYLAGLGGVFAYDYATAGYLVAAAKADGDTTVQLFGDDLAETELYVPEVTRHAPWVLNSYAAGPRTEAIEQAQAATGIRSDILLRTPIAQDVDTEVTLQTALAVIPLYEAHLRFVRLPAAALAPGTLVELAAANQWSSESSLAGVTWRVRGLRLRAAAPPAPLVQDVQLENTRYRLELAAVLEQQAEPRIERPAFRAPVYPGHVEGKVVSEQGEDGQKTYQVYQDADTSLDEYEVKVPLWADQIVSAPLEPIFGSGNIYMPSYRDERVLLALDVHAAKIARLLEWRAGAPLSMDVQGEHILFGKADDSQTSVNHVYDGDNPVLNVKRTNKSDTALIQLKEGTLTLQVKEEGGE
jgi:hypothetical protein